MDFKNVKFFLFEILNLIRSIIVINRSACQISEEFIHGPLSEDTQIKIERNKLNNEILEHVDSNLSDLIFETENDNLLNGFQVENLRNIIQVFNFFISFVFIIFKVINYFNLS